MTQKRIGLLLTITWAAALVLGKLSVEAYRDQQVLGAIGLTLVDITAAAAMILMAGGIGTLLMRDLPGLSTLEHVSMRGLLGLGVVSGVVLLIGMLGIIPPRWLGWLITISGLFALNQPMRRWISSLVTVLRDNDVMGSFETWLKYFVMALLAVAFLVALVPPTQWDALSYHLEGPRYYLQAGRIIADPENAFLSFPLLMEMLYLWIMILARARAAALLHWAVGGLLIVLVLGFSQRIKQPRAGWIAAVALLGGELWRNFTWPYTDLSAICNITATLAILHASSEDNDSRKTLYLIWAGVFIGLAMGTKYTVAPAAIAIGVVVLWINRSDGLWSALKRLSLVVSVAVAVFLPWMIKNTLLDANPLAPMLWGTSQWDAIHQKSIIPDAPGLQGIAIVVMPIQTTVFSNEGTFPYQGAVSALVFGLAPFALVGQRNRSVDRRRLLGTLGVFSVIIYIYYTISGTLSTPLAQVRLMAWMFPSLALLGGTGVDYLLSGGKGRNFAPLLQGIVVIGAVISLSAALLEMAQKQPLGVAVGVESEDAYLTRLLGSHFIAMQRIAHTLPEDARVLTLWEPRILYCEGRCFPDLVIDRWWHDRQLFGDAASIAEHWRSQGITHVLIFETGLDFQLNEDPYDPMTQDDIVALNQMRSEELTRLWNVGSYSLYALNEAAIP